MQIDKMLLEMGGLIAVGFGEETHKDHFVYKDNQLKVVFTGGTSCAHVGRVKVYLPDNTEVLDIIYDRKARVEKRLLIDRVRYEDDYEIKTFRPGFWLGLYGCTYSKCKEIKETRALEKQQKEEQKEKDRFTPINDLGVFTESTVKKVKK